MKQTQQQYIHYYSTFDLFSEPVLVINRNREILYYNDSCEKSFENDTTILENKKCYQLLCHKNEQCNNCPVNDLTSSSTLDYMKKNINSIRLNGKPVTVSYKILPKIDEAENEDHILIVIKNIEENAPDISFVEIHDAEYKFLFNCMQSGIAVHEIRYDEKGQPIASFFIDVNPAFEELTGLSRQKIISKNTADIIPGLQHSWLKKFAEIDRTGKHIRFKDYTSILDKYFDILAYKIGQNKFAVILLNITESEKSKILLKEKNNEIEQQNILLTSINKKIHVLKKQAQSREKYLNSIFKAAPIGIGVVINRNITYANEQLLKITGYEKEDFINKNALFLYPGKEEYLRVGREKYAQIDKNGIGTVETIWVTKKGHLINVLLSSAPIDISDYSKGVSFSALDITEIKTAENKLKQWKNIFDNAEWGIAICNASSQTFELINKAFAKMHDYEPGELLGMPIEKVFAEEEIIKLPEIISKADQIGNIIVESFHLKKDGSIFPVSLNITVVKDQYGKPLYRIVNMQDITHQKEMERDLILAKEKAEESDKLKSAFLANMSHEIRTPMNALLGFTQLLTLPNITEERKEMFIQAINNSSQVLLSVINDILDLSKVEAGQVQIMKHSFSLNDLFEALNNVFQTRSNDKDISIKCFKSRYKNIDETFYSDEIRLKQIMSNLIDNAIKFTDQGTIIFGYVFLDQNGTKIIPDKTSTVSKIEFFVEDTGIGIAKEDQEVIFERFRQLDMTSIRQRGGNGLGLSIVKALVELLGSTIQVDSEPGRGSRFFFRLTHEQHKQEKATSETGFIYPGIINKNWHNYKILIAEDEETNFLYLEELLLSTGIEIIHTTNGMETVEYCQKNEDVDLVLMDLKMPYMGGVEATRRIKQFKPGLPVIAQTAYAFSKDTEEAFEAGCDEYLTKPLEKRKLFAIIEKYLK